MKNNDGNKPASFEEIAGISEEYMRELDEMCAQAEADRERLNLVPSNAGGEKYISDRYPIVALYARTDLQEIAVSDFKALLTETEIQAVRDVFFDTYPHEIYTTLVDAIELVLNERQKPQKKTQ